MSSPWFFRKASLSIRVIFGLAHGIANRCTLSDHADRCRTERDHDSTQSAARFAPLDLGASIALNLLGRSIDVGIGAYVFAVLGDRPSD